MSGFSRGFQVGFNAVDSVIRQKDEKERADRRDKRDDERWSFEKERMDRERQKAADLAAAADVPAQGVAVGAPGSRNFATNSADQAMLKEQDAAIAEMEGRAPSPAQAAVGSGREIMDPSDPRAQDSRQGYLSRVASVQRKHGDVTGSLTTEELGNRIAKEGYRDALDYLLATGDAEGAQKRFNGTGRGRIEGKLVATPTKRVGANGVEMPDYTLSVDDGKGNVRQLGSALTMRFMADNPAEYLKLLNQEQEGALRTRSVTNAERATDASIRQGDRRIDLAERQQQEAARHNRAQEGIAGARLKLEREKRSDEIDGTKFEREIAGIEKVLGRRLTETEKLGKLGFKSAKDENGFVDDVAKEWAKNNLDAKPQDIANFKADLSRQVRAAPVALEVEGRIKALTPDQRPAAIAEAKQRFGLTDEWFVARGIDVPKGPQPAGTPPIKPSAPDVGRTQGAAGMAAGTMPAAADVQPPVRPAQAAAAPPQAAAPQRQMGEQEISYVRAVQALLAQQKQLAARAAAATNDAEKAAISAKITELGAQIQRTQDEARSLGIVVQ